MSAYPNAICNFKMRSPRFQSTQEYALDWIADSHIMAESISRKKMSEGERQDFEEGFRKRLHQVCCKPDMIHTRGHELDDFLHKNWDGMLIYRLGQFPQGVGLEARQNIHREFVDSIFEYYYNNESDPPEDLIHVSCTGYVSPSSAQKVVSQKKWGETTTVTHLYHMGCYASIPAIRLGSAYVGQKSAHRTDIVHTELCTLHLNPSSHLAEHLVAQSLFADGFMKYSICNELHAQQLGKSYLKIHTTYEQMIPNSSQAMEWLMTDWGFQFVLSKEIPFLIAKQIKSYVETLCEKAKLSPQEMLEKAVFAIHPGGPKIIQHAQRLLGIRNDQVKASLQILHKHGNMSSATLPHVWENIIHDAAILNGTKIISLAFGPGLIIAGAILEKKG